MWVPLKDPHATDLDRKGSLELGAGDEPNPVAQYLEVVERASRGDLAQGRTVPPLRRHRVDEPLRLEEGRGLANHLTRSVNDAIRGARIPLGGGVRVDVGPRPVDPVVGVGPVDSVVVVDDAVGKTHVRGAKGGAPSLVPHDHLGAVHLFSPSLAKRFATGLGPWLLATFRPAT